MGNKPGNYNPKLKDFHDLSLQLISFAEKGRFISDYYRDISKRLLEFSGGSYLSFVTSDAGVYYRISFYRDKEGSVMPLEGLDVAEVSNSFTKKVAQKIPCGFNIKELEKVVFLNKAAGSNFSTETGGLYIPNAAGTGVIIDYEVLLVLPVRVQGKIVGTISLAGDNKQLIKESEIELYQYIFDLIGFARNHRRAKFLLGERIKELKTIYKIARLGSEIDKSLDYVLAGAVDIIPLGFLHSESACCKIVYANKVFKSKCYKTPIHTLIEDILVDNEIKGFVEVGYTVESNDLDKEPFLKEEQPMLRAIAGELGYTAERKKFEDERERLQQQLLHADRLATVGQLTAGVAHELNEPLGGILGFAQLIKKYGEINESVEKDVDKIIKASLHGREIIRKLMLFSRQTPPEKAMININEKIDEGLYLLESRIKKSNITLVKEFAEDLPLIKIDLSQLNQVIVNLVVNAIQAMPAGGQLTIKTSSSINSILLVVSDTGIGMTKEQIDQIFIPFYTTKGINEGVGLGLPVALGIVQSHRGSICVNSRPGKGTTFTVKFPIEGENNNG